ncbi:DUF1217 domain-containing protein [Yoonia maritima]|uniref:DUF1217 domain-containing protein n=1 Tax=Yoonia maritima TaxID=1435347 RepID=UPI000D0E5D7B|nr:DUF1217 domain-containing protein [Yoonia maritima]
MTFQPVVPLSGYGGWRFLERTLDSQQEAFTNSQPIVRDTEYFRENIGNVQTAADLVSDRRLLSVALGAFGLDDDINSQFFIRKILEDGTSADDALANRMADNRYADFSAAFGFGDQTAPSTQTAGFADDIIGRYEVRQFEQAVGEQDNDLRLAMSVETGIADILSRNSSQAGQWYSVMGNAPMRNVFQTALGLPSSTSSIDLDQQLEIFQERSQAVFGTDSLADFSDPEQQETLVRMFLIRSEAAKFATSTGGSTALTLLQSVPSIF